MLDAIGGLEGLKKLTDEQYAQLEAAIIGRDKEERPRHDQGRSTVRSRASSLIDEIVFMEEKMAEMCTGGAALRLRRGRDTQPPRLPHPPVPLQQVQPAHRRVRGHAGEPRPVPAQHHQEDPRAHRPGQGAGRALLR